MEITCFDDLLSAARAQVEPQRLLFVFVQAELPEAAGAYVARLQELVGVPITMVSTGPERESTIRF